MSSNPSLGGRSSDESPHYSGDDPISLQVVESVAAFRGVDPLELDPLAETIDADALNALFSPVGGRDIGGADVSFTYADARVTVTSRGEIDLREADRFARDE